MNHPKVLPMRTKRTVRTMSSTFTEADYLAALHGYISSVTGLAGKKIFRGNQSREVLPKKGAYCIYTPLFRRRVGTNLYNFDAKD